MVSARWRCGKPWINGKFGQRYGYALATRTHVVSRRETEDIVTETAVPLLGKALACLAGEGGNGTLSEVNLVVVRGKGVSPVSSFSVMRVWRGGAAQ